MGRSARPQRLLRDGDQVGVFISHNVGTLMNKTELEKWERVHPGVTKAASWRGQGLLSLSKLAQRVRREELVPAR